MRKKDGRYMENKEKAEGTRCRDVATWKTFFDFYALLATRFCLYRRLFGRRGARCCSLRSITMLTALSIHPFKVKKRGHCVVTRFTARFLAGALFMFCTFSFSCREIFSSCFTYLFISFWHRTPARGTP